jgi:hypothetical protein
MVVSAMRRRQRRVPRATVPAAPLLRATAAGVRAGAVASALAVSLAAAAVTVAAPAGASAAPARAAHDARNVPPPGVASPGMKGGRPRGAGEAAPFGQIILPDLLVVAPRGISRAALARIRKLAGVRHVIGFDGGEIRAGGKAVSVIGVRPSQFRAWTPLRTASNEKFWTALTDGRFVAASATRHRLGLRPGARYPVAGARSERLAFGGSGALGVHYIDLVVNSSVSRRLGLVHQVAALISAPGAQLTALTAAVRKVTGQEAKIVSVRGDQTPVAPAPGQPAAGSGSGLPTSYPQLFQESAAQYCPALPWTVLAAIGQIESADGTNVGPSSAGAEGPMQFLPSTWSSWGISGFGRPGPPDIMNPYDAVPSAARMLCADGASRGTSGLRAAIFAYNHAGWYVNEVLALAAQYARDYPAR